MTEVPTMTSHSWLIPELKLNNCLYNYFKIQLICPIGLCPKSWTFETDCDRRALYCDWRLTGEERVLLHCVERVN